MKVEDLMTPSPHVCHKEDSLQSAAELMWSHDIGCLPVVDDESRLVGVITDRDVCMGGFTRRQALHRVRVAESMATDVTTCETGDRIAKAASLMQKQKVRRLPVIDKTGALRGMLSMNDLIRAAAPQRGGRRRVKADVVLEALAGVCDPRREAERIVDLQSIAKPPRKAATKRKAATPKKKSASTKKASKKRSTGKKKR